MREAQFDRNAAALFFFQAIRIDAGERANERRFSVIDVSRGADDDAVHERIAGRLLLKSL